jgi:hypothetical protein
MDIVQWGRMFWVWVQHDKMVMSADISSAVLIKSGSKVLQNVSPFYHFNSAIPKHPTRDTNCHCLSLAVGWL